MMKYFRQSFLFTLLMSISFVALSQGTYPVSWKFSSEEIAPLTYKVKFQATIKEPYHIYPQQSSEGGLGMPTKFLFDPDPDVEFIGEMEEQGMEGKKENAVAYYSKGVTFTQTIKVKAETKKTLAFTIKYMACTNVMCLPPATKKFTVALRKQGRSSVANKKEQSAANARKRVSSFNCDDFAMSDTSGKIVSSKDIILKSKYTYIDFWASWCTPCRAQARELIPVYEKYKSLGFEVIGVSLDTDASAWKRAINADKYTWTNISDMKGFESSVIKKYGIVAIPGNFIIDNKGVVVAMDLHGKSLEKKLSELF